MAEWKLTMQKNDLDLCEVERDLIAVVCGVITMSVCGAKKETFLC